jgi:hypothetical protein
MLARGSRQFIVDIGNSESKEDDTDMYSLRRIMLVLVRRWTEMASFMSLWECTR